MREAATRFGAVPLRSLSVTPRNVPIFSPSAPPAAAGGRRRAFCSAGRAAATEAARAGGSSAAENASWVRLRESTEGFRHLYRRRDKKYHPSQDWRGPRRADFRPVRARDVTFDKDKRTATLSLPPPGAEPGTAVLAGTAGQPGRDAWMDGDGRMISPPRNSQPVVAQQPSEPELPPGTSAGGDGWMGPAGSLG